MPAGLRQPGPSALGRARDPSGLQVTLQGTAGLRAVVRNSVNHNDQGQPVETVLNSVPNYQVLKQTTQLGDFEGIVTWGFGIRQPELASGHLP
jgi:hypothetical protein